MFRFSSVLKYSLSTPFITRPLQSTKFLASIPYKLFSNNNRAPFPSFDSSKNKTFFSNRDQRNKSAQIPTEANSKKIYQQYFFKKNEGSFSEFDYEEALLAMYHLGTLAKQAGEYTKAEKYWNEGIDLASTAEVMDVLPIMIYNDLGNLLAQQGRYDEALESLIKGKELMESPEFENFNNSLERNILIRGVVYRKQGENDPALDLFRELIEMVNRDSNKELLSWVVLPYLELGSIYYEEGDLQTAVETWEKGIDIITQGNIQNVEKETREIYKNLSNCYLEMKSVKEKQKAIEYFQKYISLIDKNDHDGILEILKFSNKLCGLRNFSEGFDFCKQFLNLAGNQPAFKNYISYAYLTLASIRLIQNNLEESRTYFNQALSLCKSVFGPDGNEILRHYNDFYRSVPNDTNIIKEHSEEMKRIAEACKGRNDIDKTHYLQFLFWTANSLIEHNDWEGTIKYFEECFSLNCESVLNEHYLESMYNSLGWAYFNIKQLDKALFYAEKGVKICQQFNFQPELEGYKELINKIKDIQNPKDNQKKKQKK